MINRKGHPRPDVAAEAMQEFISQAAIMGDGSPATPPIVTVLMVGAYIGCRVSLLFPTFALAIAEYGNDKGDTEKIYAHIKKTFNAAYLEHITEQMENFGHNMGFDIPVKTVFVGDEEEPAPTTPGPSAITDDDAKEIMDGLDDWYKFFGKGKRDA